ASTVRPASVIWTLPLATTRASSSSYWTSSAAKTTGPLSPRGCAAPGEASARSRRKRALRSPPGTGTASAVLEMEEEGGADEEAQPRGGPGRERDRDLVREAEREDDVGEEVEEEAGDDAGGDHQGRPAAALHPEAEGGGDHDQGAEQEGARQEPVEVELVA